MSKKAYTQRLALRPQGKASPGRNPLGVGLGHVSVHPNTEEDKENAEKLNALQSLVAELETALADRQEQVGVRVEAKSST